MVQQSFWLLLVVIHSGISVLPAYSKFSLQIIQPNHYGTEQIYLLAAELSLGINHPLQPNSGLTPQQPVQQSFGDMLSAFVSDGEIHSFSTVPQLNSSSLFSPLPNSFLTSSSQDILTGNSSDAPLVHSDVEPLNLKFTQSFNKSRTSTEVTLSAAVKIAAEQLEAFLADPAFTARMQQAFEGTWDVEAGRAALSQLLNSDITTPSPLRLEILPTASSAETIVQGAFAAQANTIYLFEDFLSHHIGNPQAVAAVLLEEIGHYLDTRLNSIDSAGDEGAIFAALVQTGVIDEAALQVLQAEEDAGLLHLNGQTIDIEQSAVPLRLERQLGQQGDTIISDRDFDGDGKTDLTAWNSSTSTFVVRTSSSNWNSAIVQ